jgi:thiamine pyrophosphokinase
MGEITVGEEDFCIAVDGGLSYCPILGVEPDLILGDFDSVSEQEKEAVKMESLEKKIMKSLGYDNPYKDVE